MRKLFTAALIVILCSCSLADTATRINVDYNSTLEAITNELTLLNVVRASEGLPLHYTSVQRLTGSATLNLSTGVNAQLKDNATTTATTLANVVTRTVATGGHIYVPSASAALSTGPSFDVNILDTQVFYQGILAGIPLSTVNNFLLQGLNSRWLTSLLVARIEFRLKEKTKGYSKQKGELLRTIVNSGSNANDEEFALLLKCYTISGAIKRPATIIAPLSRVGGSKDRHALTLQDLAMLDGAKLDISGVIPGDPSKDKDVMVTRPGTQQAAQLTRSPDCPDEEKTINGKRVALPPTPPPEPVYVGSGQLLVLADDERSGILVDTDITVTLRSTEGLIQFIGRCLRKSESESRMLCEVGDQELFALRKGSPREAVVSTNLRGTGYYVANDEYSRRTMDVIALIERLINLQKSSTDRPITVPVQVVP